MVGLKKVRRIYAEEKLQVRKRKGRKKPCGPRIPAPIPQGPNQRWSLDFVHDQFACGRRFRGLNVVDDVTRECLAAIPDTSISGRRVARELTALIDRRGKPGMIVSDNGTELTSNASLKWCAERTAESAGNLYSWAEANPLTTPFVTDPQLRSNVVGTIDFDDAIDATAVAEVRACADTPLSLVQPAASSAAATTAAVTSKTLTPRCLTRMAATVAVAAGVEVSRSDAGRHPVGRRPTTTDDREASAEADGWIRPGGRGT